ncbi:MAG: molybdopterin cofactor-binding domain-containing protein [Myxococcota bacterium]
MAITRRAFLVGGALAGGGLVIGYVLSPFSNLRRARTLGVTGDEILLASWVKIAPDGAITVIVPHSEMGQGVHTSLPMMLAEDLDADWSHVRMEQAPADPAFANGALARGYLLGDYQIPAALSGTADFAMRKAAEFRHVQTTGGSLSIRATGVEGMRRTGAAARWMLIQAAAAAWAVPADEITAEKSRLTHAKSSRSASYGEMASAAAKFEPPAVLPLKPRDRYTIVGRSLPRFDVPAKVDGSARYGVDTRLPGMLFAAVRASPVFGGKVARFDAVAIAGRRGGVRALEIPGAVAVVADNYWRAKQALEALPVTFDEGAGASHSSESIFAGMESALAKGGLKTDYSFGDVESAMRRAASIVEAIYRVPYLAHACMEPMNCTAHYRDGQLEIWGGFQDGLGARVHAAKAARLPLERVTLHHTAMGGGFGRRGPTLNYLEQAIAIAMQVDRPVNLIWSREEDITQDNYRNASLAHMKAGLDASGRPLAWLHEFTEKHDPTEATWIPYGIANREARYANGTDPIPFGPWRSVDNSHNGFFIESFVDELAFAAKRDPFEYRRDLLADAPRHRAVLETVASMSAWGTPAPKGRARGISLKESFGSIVAQVAEVSVGDDGRARVHRVFCAADPGEVVHPGGLTAQLEGGIIYGLTAALYGEISIANGRVVEKNFPDYPMVRMADAPAIEVKLVPSGARTGGAGEPGTPPIAAATANAVFALTGHRVRSLPLRKQDLRGPPERWKPEQGGNLS